jgi:hypothetical protein
MLLDVEPAVFTDMVSESSGSRLVVGSVRAPLWNTAWAQPFETVTLENVSVSIGADLYQAQRIEFTGVTSTRAELEALFDRSATEPLSERLAKISAKRVVIPELVTEQQIGATRRRTIYREVVATDVIQGTVKEITAANAGTEVRSPTDKLFVTQGRAVLNDFHAPTLARLYVEQAGPTPAPMARIYGAFSVEDIRFSHSDGTSGRIAQAKGRAFSARATQESWAGALSLITALAEIDDSSAEDTSRLAAATADLLGAFEIGEIEVLGTRIDDRPNRSMARIERLALRSASGGQPAEALVENLEVSDKDNGAAKVAAITWSGFSFQSSFEAMKALRGRDWADLGVADLGRLAPTLGTLRLSGLDFDLPNEASAGPSPDRIRFSLRDFEVSADRPFNGIPTNVRVDLQNLAMALPKDSADEGLKTLLDLGYETIDLSFAAAASWDQASQELSLREVSMSGANMGLLSLRATLGNVRPQTFDLARLEQDGLAAFLDATVKSFEVTVDDTGLSDRYLQQQAGAQNKTPEALRREYGAGVGLAIPLMLGNSGQARGLGQALSRSIAKPGRLTISARAKPGQTIGLLALLGATEPAKVLDKFTITANAEERR